MAELKHEINEGAVFYCLEEGNEILGVMGVQDILDVKLRRHAYVRTNRRKGGIDTQLLRHLTSNQEKPILIAT